MIFVSCNLLVAMRTSDLKVFSAFSLNLSFPLYRFNIYIYIVSSKYIPKCTICLNPLILSIHSFV